MSGCWYDSSPHLVQFSCTLSLQALPFFAHHLFLHLCSRTTYVWLFMIFLNGQLTYRLSGPSYPPLVQWHPYLPVPHGLPQPRIPTIQSPMLSLSPASPPSSLTCYPSAQHPCCPVTHALPQPSIPTLHASPWCLSSAQHPYPPVAHEMPSLSPASLPSSPSQPTSTQHSLSSTPLPSSPCCSSSALHVQFKTPINKK